MRVQIQLHAGPETAFNTPLLLTHSSHLCCHERARWGCWNRLCSQAGETQGTPLFTSTTDQISSHCNSIHKLYTFLSWGHKLN